MLRRVSELGRNLLECACVADDNQHVAELQAHVRGGHHLDTSTLQPRHRHAILRFESKLAHSLAEHRFIRHDHAFESDLAGRLHQIFVAAGSDDALEALQMRRRAHREQRVSGMDHRRAGRNMHFRLAAPLQAGHGYPGFMQARDCVDPQAVEICIVDTEIQPLDWPAARALRLFELRYLLLHINAKKNAHEDHANDDPHNTQWVSDSVGESRNARKRFIHIHSNQGLLGSAERGRIGRRSREQARRCPKGDSEDFGENHRENSAPDHNRRCKAIQHQSLVPQRSEETGADLQANGEDEKDEPELPQKLQCVVLQVKAEVTEDQSRKQNAGHAESYSANLDTRETQPNDGQPAK